MRDAVIRLQELDGTWQTLSADRATGITAEGLQLTSNAYGPDSATFELHRDPGATWPDLSAFTPVEIEIANQLCWSGRISETQVQDGSTRQLSIRCEGWQYHLDDDQLNRTWVNRSLGGWQALSDFCPVADDHIGHEGTLDISDGTIWMGWNAGTTPKTNQLIGMVYDLGGADYSTSTTLAITGSVYQEAARVSATQTTANASNYLNNFHAFASASIANWVSGTAYGANVTVCDATAAGAYRIFRSNKTIPTGSLAVSPANNSTDWNEYVAPLYMYAIGCADEAAVTSLAALSGATINTTYSRTWGGNYFFTGSGTTGMGLMMSETTGPKIVKGASFYVSGSAKSMRYIVLLMRMNASASTGVANPYGLKINVASVFSDIANSSSGSTALASPFSLSAVNTAAVSTLKASTAISDALTSYAPKIGTSKITATSTSIQALKTDGYKTPREVIDQANAYHQWIARVDENKQFVYKAKPTVPLFEVGAWSGYDFSDQAASSGDDIYSRVVVDAQGSAGAPIRVARSAGQMATSVARSNSGASTLTSAQQTSLKVTSAPVTDINLITTSGKNYAQDSWTAAQIAANDSATWDGATYSTGGMLPIYATGVFRAGVTYELRGTCQFQGGFPTSAQTMVIRFGMDGLATGSVTKLADGSNVAVTTSSHAVSFPLTASDTYPYAFRFFWTPDTDQSFTTSFSTGVENLPAFLMGLGTSTIAGGNVLVVGVYATTGGVSTGQQNLSLYTRSATLAERRGIRKTYQLSAPGVQTTATLAAIGDAWLFDRLRAQLRGSLTCTGPTSIRQVATGDPVHPSRLLLSAGEMLRLADRIDPDTGALGRDARIASINYDHDSQQVTMELDNRRDNLQAFLNRLGVV